jgi:hypothetical protein
MKWAFRVEQTSSDTVFYRLNPLGLVGMYMKKLDLILQKHKPPQVIVVHQFVILDRLRVLCYHQYPIKSSMTGYGKHNVN